MRWICDEANGLGEREDETYLVGSYDEESEIIEQGDVANLQACPRLVRGSEQQF